MVDFRRHLRYWQMLNKSVQRQTNHLLQSKVDVNKVLRIYVTESNMEFIFEKYVSHMRHLFDKIPIRNAYLIVRIYLSPGIHLAIAIQSALTEQPDQ